MRKELHAMLYRSMATDVHTMANTQHNRGDF